MALDSTKLREQLAVAIQEKNRTGEHYHQWVGSISLLEEQLKIVLEQEEMERLDKESKELENGQVDNQGE